MRGEVRARRWEGLRRRRRKRRVHGERPDSRREVQGTRGAHPEHGVHGRDLGGVKPQRLVERKRVLPSRREGHMRCGARLRAGRREGVEAAGRREGVEAAAAQAACTGEGPIDSRLVGARARADRTLNMRSMSVTLEVSKLSGWLNANASCRVEGRGAHAHAMRGEVRDGRREGVERRRRKRHARGKARLKAVGGQGTRGAHPEHLVHGRDLGGVPAGNVRVEVRQLIEEPAHVGDH